MRDLVITVLTPVASHMTGVSPNALTTASLVTGVLAGAAYAQTAVSPAFYLVGGLLVAASGIADGLDGIVARKSGLTTATGDYFDHLADRFVEVAVLGGLALSVNTNRVLGLSVLVLVLLHSYVGTQIEASFGRRHYGGAGKPHLFLGLVLVSTLLAVFPAVTIPLGGTAVSLQNCLYALLGAANAASIVQRARLGWQLARRLDRGGAA